ncbi:hypothetical protein [Methanosarcina sp. UBA5]|nr:hypothetical protein [Methanosarcina sp. UBA5]
MNERNMFIWQCLMNEKSSQLIIATVLNNPDIWLISAGKTGFVYL